MKDESSGSSSANGRLKRSFAYRFISALSRIRRRRRPSSFYRGSRRIKRAADASMAYAVGSRRAWSRAILRRLRVTRPGSGRYPSTVMIKNQKKKKKKVPIILKPCESRAEKLRSLIPGGESMDLCSLLDETAHYIRCLSTQVQVMQNIADRLCS
ncbi:hypothetical protein H6P81_013572 [Aristolochia fimbriata]|uniref:IBH1-like N-terminal domain-containing protein n=1 Tax=Aristolochia fimbriata TaxID=158543 RepID=A0AAV7EGP8_ARIFI|nr:hypothetical protein H6P81_013572 [Aristolochia fimbriata]